MKAITSTHHQPTRGSETLALPWSKVTAGKYYLTGQFYLHHVSLVSKPAFLIAECYCLPILLIPKKGGP